jgi:hypothetical protein
MEVKRRRGDKETWRRGEWTGRRDREGGEEEG